MNYKYLSFIIIFVIFLIGIPLLSNAQIEIPNPLQQETIEEVIAAITEVLKIIAIPIGTVMLIISGIQYLASTGNEEKITKAKKTMLYTIIGLAVVIGVDFIVDVVVDVLGLSGG